MKYFRLDSKYITQPIQLLGASLIGSVLLVGEFLYASLARTGTALSWLFGITAILIFPTILVFIFILQTKFRDQIQSDPYYHESKKMKYQEESAKAELTMKDVKKWMK